MKNLAAGLVAAVTSVASEGRIVSAQASSTTRVVSLETAVMSRPMLRSEVVRIVPPNTSLEVIGKENDWDWVVLPPDANGTRHSGWVRVRNVDFGTVAKPARLRWKRDRAKAPKADRSTADLAVNEKKLQHEQEEKLKREQAQLKRERAETLRQEQAQLKLEQAEKLKQEQAQLKQEQAEKLKQEQAQKQDERRVEKAKRELEQARRKYDKVSSRTGATPTSEQPNESSLSK